MRTIGYELNASAPTGGDVSGPYTQPDQGEAGRRDGHIFGAEEIKMPTYQEQLAANKAKKEREGLSEVGRAMLAMSELATINDGLAILQREGLIFSHQRFDFCKAYVAKHPEINKQFKREAQAAKTERIDNAID